MHLPRKALLAGAVSALVLVGPMSAGANAATPRSQASAQSLSGTVGGTDLATLVGEPATVAQNFGGAPVTKNESPDPGLFNEKVSIPLQTVLSGLSSAPGLSVGALTQNATAAPDGSATGSVQVASTTLNLDQLTGGASSVLGSLKLSVGALSAIASQAKGTNGQQTGRCDIASLGLDASSPALAALVSQLTTALAPLDQLATTLEGLSGLSQGLITVSGVPTVAQFIAQVGTVSLLNGAITASLTTGALHIDLKAALQALGLNLCGAVNSHLLAQLSHYLATNLPDAITGLLSDLLTQTVGAFQLCSAKVKTNCISVKIAGHPVSLPGDKQTIKDALASAKTQLTQALAPVLTGITSGLSALNDALQGVLDIVTNAQSTADGKFSETAMQIILGKALPSLPSLPGIPTSKLAGLAPRALAPSDPGLQLNLAVATVGPGAVGSAPSSSPSRTATTNPTVPIKVDAGSSDGSGGGVSPALIGIALLVMGGAGYAGLRLRQARHS